MMGMFRAMALKLLGMGVPYCDSAEHVALRTEVFEQHLTRKRISGEFAARPAPAPAANGDQSWPFWKFGSGGVIVREVPESDESKNDEGFANGGPKKKA